MTIKNLSKGERDLLEKLRKMDPVELEQTTIRFMEILIHARLKPKAKRQTVCEVTLH